MSGFRAHPATATALFSAALILVSMPLAAHAADTRTVAVQAGDLNLARDAGRAALQSRITRAVEEVCGPAHPRTTAEVQAYATCSKTARANATAQYDAVIAKAQMGMKVAGDRKSPVQ